MPSPSKLSSLLEREESPPSGFNVNIDAVVSSPVAPPNTAIVHRNSHIASSPLKTPNAGSRFHLSLEEMHPSKVHQSTAKLGRLEAQFCFQEPETLRSAPELIKPSSAMITQSTPSKRKGSLPNHMSSPNFDFNLAPPESHLSVETQRIMDSVREEAAKIKAQMQAERDKQERKDEEANSQVYGVVGRQIAKPKGKAGRYSQVHMQEFKKMDSIAGHASTWKNTLQPGAGSLKRSKSKIRLNAGETDDGKSIRSNETDSDRVENTAPSKRVRKNYGDDASAARPLSTDITSEKGSSQLILAKPWSQSGLPSAVTTPTKASLARSASVKQMKTSVPSSIPSLRRINSTKNIAYATTPRTEGSKKHLNSLTGFGSVKSILHRRHPKFSDDPTKVAAGTHLPAPGGTLDLDKDFPIIPQPDLLRSPTVGKRVDFTPNTKSRYDLAVTSPSPSKIPGLHLHQSDPVHYPTLTPQLKTATPAAPGDFTFRAGKTLDFEPTPYSSKTPTIRQVRPSGITTPVAAFENLPSIPHGMPNKKRRRADSDDEGVENIAPTDTTDEHENGPRAKRVKSSPQKDGLVSGKGKNSKTGSTIPKVGEKEKKKAVLSLSRLHMLARPKDRR